MKACDRTFGKFLLVPALQGRVGRKRWGKKQKQKLLLSFFNNLSLSINALKKGKIILNKFSLQRIK